MSSFVVRKKDDISTLRVAFPYAKGATAYEPARIHLAPEYIFLENVFSPLVEMSAKGEVAPGVASSYRWVGNELRLKIRNDLKTISGNSITALDAEFSLKRVLSMPENTHGDFRQLLCGDTHLTSPSHSCEGIRVEDDELILKTTDAGKTFLLPMLTAIDFAIIPRSSIDPTTNKIVNFHETTGPYYVSRDSAKGEIELKANPNHYHYSTTIPQTVMLIPTQPDQVHGSLDDFSNGKVDLITTVDSARADDVIEFSREQSQATLHTSMNIRSFVLTFTDRGLTEFSSQERFAIGKKVRAEFVKRFAGTNGYEASEQFLPPFGEGSVEKEKMTEIARRYQEADALPRTQFHVTLVRLGDPRKFSDALRAALPSADISVAQNSAAFSKYKSLNEMPHMVITGPDTGFLEDIGLITYSMNAGYFGLNKTERVTWLRKYMETPSKERRLEALRTLHEASLEAPLVVPLLVAPYAALVRQPWRIELSQFYANNQLWLIRTN